MKNLLITLFCISTFSISTPYNRALIGIWNIIEFTIVNNNQTNKTTKDALKENNSVWDLTFFEDGTLKQTSNMHNGSVESQEGTWKTENGNLILYLIYNEQEIKIEYIYELKEGILILNRSNPAGTMKIITKFKKGKKV